MIHRLFKKKKTESKESTVYNNIFNEWVQEKDRLKGKSQNVFILNESLKVYLEGPDKEAAIKKLEQNKIELRNQIAIYDEVRQRYIKIRMLNNKGGDVCTSHEIIENSIRALFRW